MLHFCCCTTLICTCKRTATYPGAEEERDHQRQLGSADFGTSRSSRGSNATPSSHTLQDPNYSLPESRAPAEMYPGGLGDSSNK